MDAAVAGARAHAGLAFRGNGTCACREHFYGEACELGECPAGMGLEVDMNGVQLCKECIVGMYKAEIGNDPCVPCPVGSTPSYNRTSCMCEAGSYFVPIEGAAGICTACPAGSSTLQSGAESIDACVMPPTRGALHVPSGQVSPLPFAFL